ncbi:putative membrane protein YfcA [Stella humosa]|uniref:Probable membrane transporter protein n=1 Tax=Stella humosa TaxID=94 RepID=A0A3N1LP09_9PROT|nr:sulfite exporter TauE/SafE family protein [Stella humosa]ROP90955.1 putative membrane protein YfcA [Stella humosa]
MQDPLFLVTLALCAALVGAFAGFLAGLLGVGGGIVIVPMLYMALGLLDVDESVRMHTAVATSLATLIPTAWNSMRSHRAKGAVDDQFLRSWGPWILTGACVGILLGGGAKPAVLTAVFGLVALVVAIHMAVVSGEARVADRLPEGAARIPMAVGIGGFSAIMGIGGGTLAVPLLTLFNYPIRRAIGTSSAVGLIVGIPGAIGFAIAGWGVPDRLPWSLGYVSLVGFIMLAPTQTLMAPVGARLAHAIPQAAMRRVFAAFLAIVSLRMLWSAFG